MNVVDRIRLEYAVQRYDFWLELRGVEGPGAGSSDASCGATSPRQWPTWA